MSSNPLSEIKVLLASRSPRRKQLLEALNIRFRQASLDVDEVYPDEIEPRAVAGYLAELKAHAHRHLLEPGEILLTADSVVLKDDEVLEKPGTIEEAIAMISKLSGTSHLVITGVCLMSARDKVVFSETTEVCFDALTENEINYYVTEYHPFDKAGGYGIQDWIGWARINRISGSYSNVMGLPTRAVYHNLLSFL